MAGVGLRVTEGQAAGTTIQFDGELEIGRGADAAGALGGDQELSRKHARITRAANGDLLIQDLGSTNGTFVNGTRINAPTPIRGGDRIQVGGTTLEVEREAQATASRPSPAGATAARDIPAADTGRPTAVGAVPPLTPPPAAPPVPPSQPAASPTPAPGPAPFVRRAGGPPAPAAQPREKRSPALAIAVLLIGLAIGGGVGALIWAGGDEGGGRTEDFFAMAQGFSSDRLNRQTGQLEINIQARTFNTPHNIRSLRVHKFLDNTTPPPQRVYDATYTFTTLGRDTLVLEASGEALEPEGPDKFFAQTHEAWRVTDGTGVFEGVRGEGQLDTALVINRRDGANLVKYFTGKLEFPD